MCLSCFIAIQNTYSTRNLCKVLYYLTNNLNILIFKVKSCSQLQIDHSLVLDSIHTLWFLNVILGMAEMLSMILLV